MKKLILRKPGKPIMRNHPLPIDKHLSEIASVLEKCQICILSAAPASGKTTVLPAYLLEKQLFEGKILMLESRRIAVRAAVQRIAWLLNEQPGQSAGMRTRDETLVSRNTKLEIITEAILLRMLQKDPSLSGVSLVIFDEFHERTLHADTAFAFLRETISALRPDLKILIMSATLDSEALIESLPDAHRIHIEGREFPVHIEYRPLSRGDSAQVQLVRACCDMVAAVRGDILVFLPGISDIRKTEEALRRKLPAMAIESIHGSYSFADQRSVIEKKEYRRIVLATNIAETSLTIDGIEAVVDSGLEKRSVYNPSTSMEHLQTMRITAQSAAQRAGRAGRTCPGKCIRLWGAHEILGERRPAILDSDLAALVMECLQWGSPPGKIGWLTAPPQSSIQKAFSLLNELGMCEGTALSETGRAAAALTTHPRLSRMILCTNSELKTFAVFLAACLTENTGMENDIIPACQTLLERGITVSLERQIDRITKEHGIKYRRPGKDILSAHAGELLWLAYPDRAAMKTGDTRYILTSGRAARTFSYCAHPYVIACDLEGGSDEGVIRAYAAIDYETLARVSGGAQKRVTLEWEDWEYSVHTTVFVAGLPVSSQKGGRADREQIEQACLLRLEKEGLEALPWKDDNGASPATLFRRICFYCRLRGLESLFSTQSLLSDAAQWLVPFLAVDSRKVLTAAILEQALEFRLGYERLEDMHREVPAQYLLPSGRKITVDYSAQIPVIAGRVQEFFGCASVTKICGIAPLIHLLSPAGRSVQITDDIGGFWERAYREVRKELAGRYPKHYWPDDPLGAEATRYAKRKKPEGP